jgi:hypothetical protein
MINTRDYDEKRDHIRMKLDTPVKLKLDTGICIEGICVDLSVNGMQLELDQAIKKGQCVEACIRSGMGKIPDLFSKVIVVRTTQVSTGRYLHGVQIESMH